MMLTNLQGKALQALKDQIPVLEAELADHRLAVTAAAAEKDANFSLLQEAMQRAEVGARHPLHGTVAQRSE